MTLMSLKVPGMMLNVPKTAWNGASVPKIDWNDASIRKTAWNSAYVP